MKISHAIVGISSLALAAIPTFSSAAGTSGAQFLKLGAGARAAAMGDAQVACVDNVDATYWNPAGLADVDGAEISATQNNWLVGSQYQTVAGAANFRGATFGVSVQRMDFGRMDRYTAAD